MREFFFSVAAPRRKGEPLNPCKKIMIDYVSRKGALIYHGGGMCTPRGKKESSFCAGLSFDRLYITCNLYLVVFLRHLISVTRSDTAAVTAERLLLTFSVLSLPDVP